MGNDAAGEQAGEDTGWFDLEEDRERWLMMGVFAGRVLICQVDCGDKTIEVPLFVKSHKVLADASIAAEVVSLGTKESKESRTLTSLNKVLTHVHMCNDVPCPTARNYLCHAKALQVIPGQSLRPGYLGPSGYKRWVALCHEVLGVDVAGPGEEADHEVEEPSKEVRPSALRRPGGAERRSEEK